MVGQIEITVSDAQGKVKGQFVIDNQVSETVINALAAKMRDDTDFGDHYVPNFMQIGNNLNQYLRVRIQARNITSSGAMYFFVGDLNFGDQGEEDMHLIYVGLESESGMDTIAAATGSAINGVYFNPSDSIKVAYTIKLQAYEISTEGMSLLSSPYFEEVSAIMLGGPDSGGVYVADNSRYVVPNLAKLRTEAAGLIDSKSFAPKGTGSFIGVSEGDLEWEPIMPGDIPYSVRWLSNYSGRPDLVIGTTNLDQELRDAYPDGTNIETRFSIELKW